MIKSTYNIRIFSKTKALFAAIIAIALLIGILLSLQLKTIENCNILPKNVISFSDSFAQIGMLCFWDFLCVWLLVIPVSKAFSIAFSFCVFVFRGAVIGNSIKIFFMNSVPSDAVFLLLSYCTVTLLLMGFTLFWCSANEARRLIMRIILSLIIAGAVSLLRILPYLVI